MLGWINDCIEKLVIAKFGVEAWHTVKQKAGCDVKDGEFLKLEHYSDKSTIDLVAAASDVSGLTQDQVLEAFGAFFVPYISGLGYESLLCCQGSNLKDWMININAIHSHLQTTFPKKMIMPEFWCEDCEDGSIILYYQSKRGNFLAPLAKGLVTEFAQTHFQLDISMDRLTTQGVDQSRFTSWRVSTRDPSEMYKLTAKKTGQEGMVEFPMTMKCPFTGVTATIPSQISGLNQHATIDKKVGLDNNLSEPVMCPHMRREMDRRHSIETSATNETSHSSLSRTSATCENTHHAEVGSLSAAVVKKLFPYHTMVNSDFYIIQVGKDLPRVLHSTEQELVGQHIHDVFDITKPLDAEWSWDWLRKLEDQSFCVEPVLCSADCSGRKFKTSVVFVNENPKEAMLIMTPDANNLEELRNMDLTLSDLPVHGCQRDAVFLREHLSTQMNNALNMEKLSKSLAKEKALLESLLPVHAAEGLRMGRTVEPILHNNVTMFFSDIVGFTKICDQLYPWEVISMLNRLYCVMDHLSIKFNLFKVETIGDAYVCCSGLPQEDEKHAENVANFAIAVTHCCKQVLSPVDQRPIQLRIGIHTGPCASGVVGVTNPRYCVFGDTVNTTARHESTGEPGKVHCSYETCKELELSVPGKFELIERGLVEMKGKGQLRTFWLSAKAGNTAVNRSVLIKLDKEIKKLLQETNFDSQFRPTEKTTRIPVKPVGTRDLHQLLRGNLPIDVRGSNVGIDCSHDTRCAGKVELSKYQKQNTDTQSSGKVEFTKYHNESSTDQMSIEQHLERGVSIRRIFFI